MEETREEIQAAAQADLLRNIAANCSSSDWLDDMQILQKRGPITPLQLALMSKADLLTVKRLCKLEELEEGLGCIAFAMRHGAKQDVISYLVEQDPRVLTAKVLSDTCERGEDLPPGTISFLARLIPEIDHHEWCRVRGESILSVAMHSKVHEEDVRTLVELWPELLHSELGNARWYDYDYGHSRSIADDDGNWDEASPIQQCLFKGWHTAMWTGCGMKGKKKACT